ncbi:MAG: CHAT domain-containing protein [bacterium]|nr:CHAT domain-containing protein [bacterium]
MKEALFLEISRKADNLEISLSEGEQTVTHYEECRLPSSDLERRCRELLHLLNAVSRHGKIPVKIFHELQQMGQVLYNEIFPLSIKKELAETSVEDIILKIDNRLVQVPWELIYTGREFFCERFNIGRIVKTQQVIASGGIKKELHPPLNMLIITDPKGDLQSAYEEGSLIRESLKQKAINITLVSSEVSVDYLKKKLLQFDLIHYAGHADYNLDDPSTSGWILEDGKFTALDIHKLSGTSPMPALVFSNACQSATTEEWQKGTTDGEKIYGLANAFLLAGVQHYIGTFWKVLDTPSTSFAIEFYRQLLSGHSIGQAMRSARMSLKERYGRENILWASYLLYGDPTARYFELSKKDDMSRRDFQATSWAASLSPQLTSASCGPSSSWNPATEWLIQEKSRGGGLLWKTRSPSELMERSWQAEKECQQSSEAAKESKPEQRGRSRLWYSAATVGMLAAVGLLFSLFHGEKDRSSLISAILSGRWTTVKAVDQQQPYNLAEIFKDENSLMNFFQGLVRQYQWAAERAKGPLDEWSSRPLTLFFYTPQGNTEGRIQVLTTKIMARLNKDERLKVIERAEFESLIQELAISSSPLANKNFALRTNEMVSGRLLNICSIYQDGSKLQLIMRLVESETTIVKAALYEEWENESSTEVIADRLVQKLLQVIDEKFPLRGKISYVVNSNNVKLNIGARQGLKSGTKLNVFKDQRITQDGEIVSEESVKVGELEVSKVTEDCGYAKVLSKSEDLAVGMKVIP